MRKRLLVTGREGQVVSSLIERGHDGAEFDVVALGRPELDLQSPASIASVIRKHTPDVIVSAAAYTAVDQAEKEEEQAAVVNGEAAGALARAAAELNIPIIHISTDYVFDGSKKTAYVETDPVAPIGAYGRTKLLGEQAVAQATGNHAILRTAWVHSPFGKNFLKTMLRLAADRDDISVVADQRGRPTSALDIADAVLKVAHNLCADADPRFRGVFHLTNAGEASWAEFAEQIFRASAALDGPSANVLPIPSSAYPTPAKRPENSRLDCGKLKAVHGIDMPDWKDATQIVVQRILSER